MISTVEVPEAACRTTLSLAKRRTTKVDGSQLVLTSDPAFLLNRPPPTVFAPPGPRLRSYSIIPLLLRRAD
jgi:hypothetical protein